MAVPVIPDYKLDFGGIEYTEGLLSFSVKLRENNYGIAVLNLDNQFSKFYNSIINTFTEVKLYVKDATESTYTQIFGGYARELLPSFDQQGSILSVGCKGYGSALEEMHCNRAFGFESDTTTSYDELSELVANVLSDFVSKSFDDWNTGYSFNTTYISDTFDGTTFTFINNPYRTAMDVVNHACDLATAIAAGADAENPTAAGPHWIVKPNGVSPYFLLGQIGDHTAGGGGSAPSSQWPDWWNTDQTGSTLTQGVDFQSLQVIDKSSEFANNVILATDFRRPAYDYWAADSTLWGNDGLDELTNDAVEYIVGTNSLRFEYAVGQSEAYFPSGENANWDVTKWGSKDTIPRINFYFRSEDCGATSWFELFTDDAFDSGNRYTLRILPFNTLDDDEWHFISIPIGPYWANDETNKMFAWTDNGGDWSEVDGITFSGIEGGTADPKTWVDDIHFTGKIVRSAYVSDNITANKEYQKVFISRCAMDDSCIATDDSGDAGRIVKAELLRRIQNPLSVNFTTGMRKSMLAGQKLYVKAGMKADRSTYAIDCAMRAMEVEHGFNVLEGAYTKVTATSDLYNTRPISSTDRWALQQEFTLINSAEAKNMRAGAEVDLLIPILKKNYT